MGNICPRRHRRDRQPFLIKQNQNQVYVINGSQQQSVYTDYTYQSIDPTYSTGPVYVPNQYPPNNAIPYISPNPYTSPGQQAIPGPPVPYNPQPSIPPNPNQINPSQQAVPYSPLPIPLDRNSIINHAFNLKRIEDFIENGGKNVQDFASSQYFKKENLLELISKGQDTQWNFLLQILTSSINATQSKLNLISNTLMTEIIDSFQEYEMDKDQKLEFIKIFKKYLNSNSETRDDLLNEPFKKLGTRIQQLQIQLYFKQKSYLDCLKFISSEKSLIASGLEDQLVKFYDLKFNFSQDQCKTIYQRVKHLCHNQFEAFSFISLYMVKSIEHNLKIYTFTHVEQLIDTRVNQLKKIGTALTSLIKIDKDSNSSDVFKEIKTNIHFEEKYFKEGKIELLTQWIQEKIRLAQRDYNEFQNLEDKLQNGYNFKYCLKIVEKRRSYAIMRTIEKLLENSLTKYEKEVSANKSKLIDFHNKQKKEDFRLKDFIQYQLDLLSDLISKILKEQKCLKWDIKDMLRGKCTFNSVQDIEKTLKNLFGKIQQKQKKNKSPKKEQVVSIKKKVKNSLFDIDSASYNEQQKQIQDDKINWFLQQDQNNEDEVSDLKIKRTVSLGIEQKPKQKKIQPIEQEDILVPKAIYQIIQTKNRLQMSTRDFTVILRMQNGTMAELQLALNQNSFQNEFDHKFYELNRSKLFTGVTNLFLNHNKWSNQFFQNFLQTSKRLSVIQSSKLKSDHKPFFNKEIERLENDVERYKQTKQTSSTEAQNKSENGYIKQRFGQLIEKKRNKLKNTTKIPRTQQQQIMNEVQLLIILRKCAKAQEKLQYVDKNAVLKNPKLRELYADVMLEKVLYGQVQYQKRYPLAIKCQEQYKALQIVYDTPKTFEEKCRIYRKMAKISVRLNRLPQAKSYIKQALKAIQMKEQKEPNQIMRDSYINEKLHSKDYAEILLEEGQIYVTQGLLSEAETIFSQCLQIFKQHNETDSSLIADLYLQMGKIYQKQQSFKEAKNMYDSSLQIMSKKKGKHSVEVAEVLYWRASLELEREKWANAYQDALKSFEISQYVFGKADTRTRRCIDVMKSAQQH